MKKLFLASSIHKVAKDIRRRMGRRIGKKLVFVTTASEAEKGDLRWRTTDRNALVKSGFRITNWLQLIDIRLD